MEVKVNDVSVSEKELEVTLSYDEIKSDIENEVKKRSKNIQVPGFRKGKVPVSMIKKMFGDTLEYEASEKVANNQFWNVAKEKDLKPIGQPTLTDIKFNPGQDLYFKVNYEIFPDVEIKEYTGFDIEIPDFKVTDKEIDHEIEHILQSNRTTEEAEQVGDDKNYIITADLERLGEVNDPKEQVRQENIDVDLSDERVNKEIIEKAKGKKIGDKFEFSFTDENQVKEDDSEKETFNYSLEIKKIKKIILPDLNEEFIKKVTKDIQNYYDQRIDEITKSKIMSSIIEKNDFNPPKTLVNNLLEDLVKREEEESKRQGFRKFDKEEARKRLKNIAEFEVKWYILKQQIEKKEEIKISDDDLKELVKKDAEKTGLPEEKLLNYYKSSNYSEKLIDEKLFDFLKEKNNINKVDPEKLQKKNVEETK